ncbi:hypothetical protein U1Q18_010775 [Sarracenia purpurea var. burkii]
MAEDDTRSRGTVRWFDDQNGYGFISPDNGDKDLFVHQSAIRSKDFRTLQEGSDEMVTELEEEATTVVMVSEATEAEVELDLTGMERQWEEWW